MYKKPETLTLASPFSRGYWRAAADELKNLRMLTLAAIVTALRIVMGGLYIPLGDNLNIFFGYLVNGLGSAVYGPVVALLSGFATDVVGYFIHPTGAFFPGYVLSTMMGSFFYALFFYRARITVPRVVLAKLAVNLLVNVGLGAMWSAMLYSKGYYYYLAKSLAKNIGLLPLETALMWAFMRAVVPVCVRNGLLPEQGKKEKAEKGPDIR